jgi:6-phosphogluconolactonase
MNSTASSALSIGVLSALLAGCGVAQVGAPVTLAPATAGAQKSRVQNARRSRGKVHYLYATDDGSGNVSAFAIDASTGALTQVPGSPFAAGPEPWGLAVDPTGNFAYATNVNDGADFAHVTKAASPDATGSISAYAINPSNGALTQVTGSPFSSDGSEPWEMTIGPAGKFAYVTNFYSNNVRVYAIDAKSGALTQVHGSPFGTGSNPAGVTVDSTDRFAYVANGFGSSVSGYAVSASGALTQLKGSPFATGDYPWGVAIDPPDKFAYVTNYNSGSVSAYTINARSGALTPVSGSPFAAGSGAFGIAIDPEGPFLYVANEHSDTVSGYFINPSSGALTQVPGSPFAAGADSYGVAIDPSGKFVYVANAQWGSAYGTISAYRINPSSGALTPLLGSPFAAAAGPVQLAIR